MNILRLQRRVLHTRALAFQKTRLLPIPPRLLLFQTRSFCQDGSLYHSRIGHFFLRDRFLTESRSYSISNVCGHMSFLILAISFVCSDVLNLRIVALFAGLSMATFNYFHPNGRPLWLPFRWNVLFLLINSCWIAYLLKLNYDANHLKKYENWLYEEVFALSGMKRTDFLKLMRVGELKIYNKGDHLTTQGLKSWWVQILIEGTSSAVVNKKSVYEVTPGNFISELGIHSGIRNREQTSSASIVAREMCVSIRWSRGALIDIMEQHPEIGASVQAAMTADLIKKMNRSEMKLIGDDNKESYGSMNCPKSFLDYRQIVKAILDHETISKRERNMLKRYRKMHFIDDQTHERIVEECGWSMSDFDFGMKMASEVMNSMANAVKNSEEENIDVEELVQEYISTHSFKDADAEDDIMPLLDD